MNVDLQSICDLWSAFSANMGMFCFRFQVHDSREANEDVLELCVIQRLTGSWRVAPQLCSHCDACPAKLCACTRCYEAFYCNQSVQLHSD